MSLQFFASVPWVFRKKKKHVAPKLKNMTFPETNSENLWEKAGGNRDTSLSCWGCRPVFGGYVIMIVLGKVAQTPSFPPTILSGSIPKEKWKTMKSKGMTPPPPPPPTQISKNHHMFHHFKAISCWVTFLGHLLFQGYSIVRTSKNASGQWGFWGVNFVVYPLTPWDSG